MQWLNDQRSVYFRQLAEWHMGLRDTHPAGRSAERWVICPYAGLL